MNPAIRQLLACMATTSLIGMAPCSVFAQTAAAQSIDPSVMQSTRAVATQLLTELGQKLKTAISTDGPLAAVSVCKEVAPALAGSLSAQHGLQITRVGTRVRNSKIGIPNTWQKEALAKFEDGLQRGDKPAELEYWQVVESSSGQRELHYAKAIMVQPQCLACHGAVQDIATPMMEKIKQEYPDDQATGYSVGKLRGAVVITRPL